MNTQQNDSNLTLRGRRQCHVLRLLVVGSLLFVAAQMAAQTAVPFRFGSISYHDVLCALPDYDEVIAQYDALKGQYDAELRADEEEFQARYEEFLTNQATYAPAILRKRQAELEELLQRNEQFRAEATRLLQQARQEMLQPLYSRLDDAITVVANKYSLAFVLNSDARDADNEHRAIPFVNNAMGMDITQAVRDILTNE